MPEKKAPPRSGDARVPFGVPSLDRMLEGGLVAHRPYLLVGPAGTGKTTLALEFLNEGIRRGEPGLYVTIEDPPNEVRINHRSFGPEFGRIDVFDAIPDVMRYERIPFKDISAVRDVVPFDRVSLDIRKTPEFTSVEITVTALEQMLRSEVRRRGYVRMVVDSLTALQYFCMKGMDPISGAQTFLKFLSDLGTTSLLTVESPLEDVETTERMLARGEIRLFRWELEGRTVHAVGVEKFRGSSHDVRLHPYRIGPTGVEIFLDRTISRDTRRIVEPAHAIVAPEIRPPEPTLLGPLSDALHDLVTVGVDMTPVRSEIEAALASLKGSATADAEVHVARISALALSLADSLLATPVWERSLSKEAEEAFQRIAARAESARAGIPPTRLPGSEPLARQLGEVLSALPTAPAGAPSPPAPAPAAPAPPPPRTPSTPPPVVAGTPAVIPPARPPAAVSGTPPPPSPAGRPSTPPERAVSGGLSVPPSLPSPRPPPDTGGAAPPTRQDPLTPWSGVPASPAPAPPAARPSETEASRPARAIPEPPPLPTPFHGVPTSPAPTGAPPRPAGPPTSATVATEPGTGTAVPPAGGAPPSLDATVRAEGGPYRRRRSLAPRRRSVTTVATGLPADELGEPASSPETEGTLGGKPKRRALRKRRAPRVVAATAEAPPAPAPEGREGP